MKDNNLLLIFARNAVLGKVKTRLAKSLGDETALKIYEFLLQKTHQVTQEVTCEKAVHYSEKIMVDDIWEVEDYQKHLQQGDDLGQRMHHAFKNSFESGYDKVVVIGTDLFDLTPELIEDSFLSLDSNDVVLGPAKDGGYYLLGMKAFHTPLFNNKAWGTSSVREDTLKDLTNKKVHLLKELNDIDVIEDIRHHPAFTKFLPS